MLLVICHIGNRGTLVARSVGGIGKWRGMLEVLEVDVTNGSLVYVVEPYWLRRVWRLTSDDTVMR